MIPTSNQRLPLRKAKSILLRDQTVDILREAILNGRLIQGQRLNEKQLSEELGISRGPIREAIQTLEKEGLVQSIPHKGAYVTRFKKEDVVEVLALRELIEIYAMESAISLVGPEISIQLRSILDEMMQLAKCGDNAGVAEAHTRFHGVFYRNSGNKFLARLWEVLEGPLRLYLLMGQTNFPHLDLVPQEHIRMVSLVENADIIELKQEIKRHLRVNLEQLIASIDGAMWEWEKPD